MKIANIYREILHNFWTTCGISMKFSGKTCLMTTLKVTKNQGFTLCLKDIIFKKLQRGVKQTCSWEHVWLFNGHQVIKVYISRVKVLRVNSMTLTHNICKKGRVRNRLCRLYRFTFSRTNIFKFKACAIVSGSFLLALANTANVYSTFQSLQSNLLETLE